MNPAEIRSRLIDNLAAVEDRIRAACVRANRQREEVTLIAVTKYVEPEVAALLPELGVFDLGESRPQELWRKAAVLPKEVRWHMIGHLQRNKVAQTLPLAHLIHSVDSIRLLDAIQAETRKSSRTTNILLEFNLSGENAKHGFAADEMTHFRAHLALHGDGVRILGLMTMAAESEHAQTVRSTFGKLRSLLVSESEWWQGVGHPMRHLSMGMTDDFEVAIEEGATMIRIGSALVEGIIDRAKGSA